MFPFSNPVLLGGVSARGLVKYAMCFNKIFHLSVDKLGPIITSENFDFCFKLSEDQVIEVFNIFKHFSFGLH